MIVWPIVGTVSQTVHNTDAADQEIVSGSSAEIPASQDLWMQFDSLRVAEAFLKARLALADQKFVSLVIDLIDSTLYLEFQGVPIRHISIHRYYASRTLRRMNEEGRLDTWIDRPFTLEHARATIAKIPIRIVEAPRDTVAAAIRPPQEILVETTETHFILRFDRNLTLRIRQAPSASGFFRRVIFDAGDRLSTARRAVVKLSRGQSPEQETWITLRLSPEDARAIYRALPDNARLALRL